MYLYIYVSIYIIHIQPRIYVFMHVCMHVCMHLCMYACMHSYMYVCMHVCVAVRVSPCVRCRAYAPCVSAWGMRAQYHRNYHHHAHVQSLASRDVHQPYLPGYATADTFHSAHHFFLTSKPLGTAGTADHRSVGRLHLTGVGGPLLLLHVLWGSLIRGRLCLAIG